MPFSGLGFGLAGRRRLWVGYVPAPGPQRGEWGTWDWPTKVDPVPPPHLHSDLEGGAVASGPWPAIGYAAGGGGQSLREKAKTLARAPKPSAG